MDIISKVLREYQGTSRFSKDFETKLYNEISQLFVNSSTKSINDVIEAVMESRKNIEEDNDIKFSIIILFLMK